MTDTPAPVEGHTPGPWVRVDCETHADIFSQVGGANTHHVAMVARPEDADLIARAPAMASEIATLKARVAELEAADATPYREALGQIVHLLAEERTPLANPVYGCWYPVEQCTLPHCDCAERSQSLTKDPT